MNKQYSDIDLYKQLHTKKPKYGASGHMYTEDVEKFIIQTKSKTILDFGCGKETLKSSLSLPAEVIMEGYDPAIEGKTIVSLSHYDLVITTDVFEHIHENEINFLFEDILSFTPNFMYHVICNRAAYNKLPDGTNAHKTVKPSQWWVSKFESGFSNYQIQSTTSKDLTFLKLIKKDVSAS